MPKISATKIFRFEAAHFLPNHKGACADLHGHSYKLAVTVQRHDGGVIEEAGNTSDGMIVDFTDLKAMVDERVIKLIDHKFLNDIFVKRPTAENMAYEIFRDLNQWLHAHRASYKVTRIKLWETETGFVEVEE